MDKTIQKNLVVENTYGEGKRVKERKGKGERRKRDQRLLVPPQLLKCPFLLKPGGNYHETRKGKE